MDVEKENNDKRKGEHMTRCKITVLKRTINEEFVSEYTNGKTELCPTNTDDQEFISIDGAKPEGFCDFAWIDIYKYVFCLLFGGKFDKWMTPRGTVIACCTDGARPVFFKIERIDV